MEVREAKKMLQARLECMKQEDLSAIGKGCDKKCDECHLNYEQGNRGEQKEAISVGIAALEKQTARAPILEGDGYSDGHLVYDTWICPNCESSYEMDYEEHKHCPNCGQEIDWEGIKSNGEDDSV